MPSMLPTLPKPRTGDATAPIVHSRQPPFREIASQMRDVTAPIAHSGHREPLGGPPLREIASQMCDVTGRIAHSGQKESPLR